LLIIVPPIMFSPIIASRNHYSQALHPADQLPSSEFDAVRLQQKGDQSVSFAASIV